MGTDKQKGSLGDRFEQFEHQPAKDSWDKIAAGLKDSPGALGPKFKGFEHAPNLAIWSRLNWKLNRPKRAAWVAVSATLLLLGGSLAWYASLNRIPAIEGNSSDSSAFASNHSSHDLSLGPQSDAGKSMAVFNGDDHSSKLLSTESKMRKRFFQKAKYGLGEFQRTGFGKPSRALDVPVIAEYQGNMDLNEELDLVPAPVMTQEEVRADSQPKQPIPTPSSVEPAVIPIIEIPKGEEAEGGLSLKLGANLSSGGALGFANTNAMMDASLETSFWDSDPQESSTLEEYLPPLTLGASVLLPISKRLSLAPGLVYTMLKSSSKSLDATFKRHYLGVNVAGNYHVLGKGRLKSYVLAGVQADIGLAAEFESGSVAFLEFDGPKAGNQVSLIAGAGANYQFTKYLGFYLQAMATHYVYQSRANMWTQKPIWPMAQVGLRVML